LWNKFKMLTRRVIAVVLIRNNVVVQSQNFEKYLPVGRPEIAVKYLTDWGADEIILLDIGATISQGSPNFSLIEKCANSSNIPLTVGGGIASIHDVQQIFNSGADKISINSAASDQFLTEISSIYGAQSIVLAVDTKQVGKENLVYEYKTRSTTKIQVSDFLESFRIDSFGEILIQSSDRDGLRNGYNLELFHKISSEVKKPVIALGGYNSPKDLNQLFGNSSVSGGAIGNALHHQEHSLTVIKSHLDRNLNIRFETDSDYCEVQLDKNSRILKRDDVYLQELLYSRIQKEMI